MKNERTALIGVNHILGNILTLMEMREYRAQYLLDDYAKLLDYKLTDDEIKNYVNEALSWQYDGCDTFESLSKPLLLFRHKHIDNRKV